MQVFKPVVLLLLAGIALPLLAEERRHHDAHEHGVGKLDIAQEGTELHIGLDSPAVNIVGFEHAPSSDADHKALEKALAQLKDGAGLFMLPDAAGCRLVDADIATPLQDHDDPSHRGTGEHAGEHHAHEDSHEHEDRMHSDITAVWHFSCTHPEALDRVIVKLFEVFPMTGRLQVQFITGKHQGAASLSASQPAVHF